MDQRQIPLILSLDVAGNPHKWITYEDAATYYSKGLIAWQMGGDDYILRGGTCRATGQRSELEINSIIAVKGVNISKFQNRAPQLTNRSLFYRDRNICAYCGDSFSAGQLSRDHIHPRSRGGDDVWENVVAACRPCNKRKGSKTTEEANMPLLYVPYAPSRAEYLILQNRKILGDQMEFLMTRVPQTSRLYN